MRRNLLLYLLALGQACLACGGSDPVVVDRRLAKDFAPQGRPVERSFAALGSVRLVTKSRGEIQEEWLQTELAPESWVRAGWPGVWRQPRLAAGEGAPSHGPRQRMVQSLADLSRGPEDDPYHFVAIDTSRPELVHIVPGVFCAVGDAVYVARERDAGPPTTPLILTEALSLGFDDGTSWRVAIGSIEAEGFPLLTGDEASFSLRARQQTCVLSFWTTARALSPLENASHAERVEDGVQGEQPEIIFRVFLDEEEIFRTSQALGTGTSTQAHDLRLPPSTGPGQLRFSTTGALALGAIHQPRLHTLEVGKRAARPWRETRPDLTLIVGDTFRADNLEAYGGDAQIAPELNRWAQQGAVYARTWATSSWTLPSHASMFSGLLPPAAGCMDFTDRLGSGAQTLAEVLRQEGYRTVAITDRGFVSRDHGLSQGFEWFQEVMRRGEGSLQQTIQNVESQLRVDDGRPLFLFVQTYRAHAPYEVSAQTRAELKDLLADAGTYTELIEEFPLKQMGPGQPGYREFLRRLAPLYRGASRDTSRGLGELLQLLEEQGLLREGHVFLTSDHGESLGDHGLWGHGSSVYEAQIRVPLLHLGAGVQPERISANVSLLDLPPTLASLAGIDPPAEWQGSRLDQVPAERSLFAFVGEQQTGGDQGAFGAIWDNQKLYFLDPHAESVPRAFDLERDPDENVDVFDRATWARPFADRVRTRLPALCAPRFSSKDVQLSGEAQGQLNQLGYGGEEP